MPHGLSVLVSACGPVFATRVLGDSGAARLSGATLSFTCGVLFCLRLVLRGVGSGFDMNTTPPRVKRKVCLLSNVLFPVLNLI